MGSEEDPAGQWDGWHFFIQQICTEHLLCATHALCQPAGQKMASLSLRSSQGDKKEGSKIKTDKIISEDMKSPRKKILEDMTVTGAGSGRGPQAEDRCGQRPE